MGEDEDRELSKYEKKQFKREQKEQERDVARKSYKTKKIAIYAVVAVVVVIIIVASALIFSGKQTDSVKTKVTVFKSATCGCCSAYVAELQRQGFEVKTVNVADRSAVTEKYNIPMSVGSCHTTIIKDYFVEGHVPISAVKKLLEEKPDIDGIALPEMPSGSPGMPGPKLETFKIHSISGGQSHGTFMTI